MSYFYLSKKYAEKGDVYCYTYEQKERIVDFKKKFGEDCIEYKGEYLPADIVLVGDTIREMTAQEKYDKRKELDTSRNYVKDGKVEQIPPQPAGLTKPFFDRDKGEWVETATLAEIVEIKRNIFLSLYKDKKMLEEIGEEDEQLNAEVEKAKEEYLKAKEEYENK